MNNYSALGRFFHRLILGSKAVQEMSYFLEAHLDQRRSNQHSQNPVFVLGLARSGTTTLLRLLHKTGSFESLSYRDVPFVLMPTIWHRISGIFHLNMEAIERSHGDSILVDFDSPESFEAIFWRAFADEKYVHGSIMKEYEPSSDLIEKFRTYLGLVANKNGAGKRYLSKNNNNLLRVRALSRNMPDARFLIVWRNPLQTAYSLYRMNQRFSEAQRNDSFVLEYMNLIGHYEFGLNHKTFGFLKPFQSLYQVTDPNYWLSYWIYIHEFILQTEWPENVLVINYEKLCQQPHENLKKIFNAIDVSINIDDFEHGLRQSVSEQLPKFDSELMQHAALLATNLQEKYGEMCA